MKVLKRILLVESGPYEVSWIVGLFRGFQCEITAVHTAAEALAKANDSFELLLLGNELPDESGVDLLQRLRQYDSTASIPTVVFTRTLLPDDVWAGFSPRLNTQIVRPVTFVKLSLALSDFGLRFAPTETPSHETIDARTNSGQHEVHSKPRRTKPSSKMD